MRNAPKFLISMLAPLLGIIRNFIKSNVGYRVNFDSSKSKKVLGLTYFPAKKAVLDFSQKFINHNLV